MIPTNPNQEEPLVIIGSGLAGLLCANLASEYMPVILLTKTSLENTNTQRSQGGIAAVWSQADSAELHIKDTLLTGCGLSDIAAVEILASKSRDAVMKLIELGTLFDREENGNYMLGLEGAHSLPRILHAGGDATGAEIQRTLTQKIQNHPQIEILENCQATEIIVEDGFTKAVRYYHPQRGFKTLDSSQIVLATGGAGNVFQYTSNVKTATGEGLILAYQAGAELEDLEFFQFHPTALCLKDQPVLLITEALRGEGATIKNKNGKPIMREIHPLKDLAPRDIVSRAIVHELSLTQDNQVYLDTTHLDKNRLTNRFPTIYENCLKLGIDITKEMIPVNPVAHYMIGGVSTDLWGRSTVGGLYVIGEAARTGVHGANRLASNSLLEAAVFSIRVAEAIANDRNQISAAWNCPAILPKELPLKNREQLVNQSWESSLSFTELQKLMWEKAGLIRNKLTLESANEQLSHTPLFFDGEFSPERFELYSMKLLSRLLVESALQRKESRGCHFREDYPFLRKEYQYSIKKSILQEYQLQFSNNTNYGRASY
ncbi:MAG: L-aspartate oxidase [Deltaproteobacteria bacterium]|nr:L-aspartate oxidase [Deltaproteobacteria bacterium]